MQSVICLKKLICLHPLGLFMIIMSGFDDNPPNWNLLDKKRDNSRVCSTAGKKLAVQKLNVSLIYSGNNIAEKTLKKVLDSWLKYLQFQN